MSSETLFAPRIKGFGLALAYATHSASDFAGMLAGTTRHCVLPPTATTGVNSAMDLYGDALLRCGRPELEASANNSV